MKILVTGGAGFIGSHTVDLLLERGYDVRILDALTEPVHPGHRKPSYIPEEVDFVRGDVRSKADVARALEGIDAVFHLAAYQDYLPDFSTFFHVNSVGTALLYEIIVERKLPVQKVVVASSQAVYGEGRYRCPACAETDDRYPDIRDLEQLERAEWEIRCPVCGEQMEAQWTDESVVNPQNQYAISKYTQELIALNLGSRYGIPTVCMRYSIVQGPRQSLHNAYSGACRIFCLSLHFDRAPVVYEDGMQVRDFVNIADVARANVRILEDSEADFEVFNVGGGRTITVLAFARLVARCFGKDIEPELPGAFRFGDTRHIFSDISKLKALGWTPERSVEESVRQYMAWLVEQPDLEDRLSGAQRTMEEMGVVRRTIA